MTISNLLQSMSTREAYRFLDGETILKMRECDKKYQAKKRRENALEKYRKYQAYKKKYPERIQANSLLNEAIKKGEIIKGICEICRVKNVHGHHPDYSKPLEVIWLCPSHHKLEHSGSNKIK